MQSAEGVRFMVAGNTPGGATHETCQVALDKTRQQQKMGTSWWQTTHQVALQWNPLGGIRQNQTTAEDGQTNHHVALHMEPARWRFTKPDDIFRRRAPYGGRQPTRWHYTKADDI